MELDKLDALSGHRFPGGGFTIARHEDWLLRDVIGAAPGDGRRAHPLWAFAAPQRSMGITIDGVFELCGSSAADGPMLGDTTIERHGELTIGTPYEVTAGIVSTARKSGRTVGIFDVVHFTAETRAVEGDGELLCSLTNSFLFPRKAP